MKRGVAVIKAHWRNAPNGPGVYRMIADDGEVLYVGKAKNVRKRIASYTRRAGHMNRIARMIAADRLDDVHLGRDRNRGAAARDQSHQADEAALQRADARRQELSLYSDRPRPRRAADHQASRRARAQGRLFRPLRQRRRRHRTLNALQRAFLLRSCTDSFYENRTRPCLLLSDQALRRALHRRDLASRIMPCWCRRRTTFSPARAARCASSSPRR